MSNEISMTWDDWFNKFKPLLNSMEPDGFDGEPYYMFSATGEQHNFVKGFATDRVWTFRDLDRGTAIYNGYTEEDVIGYYITEETVDTDTTYEVDFIGVDQGEDPNE